MLTRIAKEIMKEFDNIGLHIDSLNGVKNDNYLNDKKEKIEVYDQIYISTLKESGIQIENTNNIIYTYHNIQQCKENIIDMMLTDIDKCSLNNDEAGVRYILSQYDIPYGNETIKKIMHRKEMFDSCQFTLHKPIIFPYYCKCLQANNKKIMEHIIQKAHYIKYNGMIKIIINRK